MGTSIAIHRIKRSRLTHSWHLALPATPPLSYPTTGSFISHPTTGSFISHSHCLWHFPEMALVQEKVLSAASAHGCFANIVVLWGFLAEEEGFCLGWL